MHRIAPEVENWLDEDGQPITPFGHAEVYASSQGGAELYGSTYSGGTGDVVFEGNKIRIANGYTRQYSAGPYIRYVAMPGTISGAAEPTLQPPAARQLITTRALVMWAGRGGLRDAQSYEQMYRTAWNGTGAYPSNGPHPHRRSTYTTSAGPPLTMST